MAQQIKAPATKSDSQSSLPRAHSVKELTHPMYPLIFMGMPHHLCIPTQTHMYSKKKNVLKTKAFYSY